jgi:hypothetical protein
MRMRAVMACVSEGTWMRTVLGIEIGQPVVEGVLSGGTSPDARPDLPAPSEAPVTERP